MCVCYLNTWRNWLGKASTADGLGDLVFLERVEFCFVGLAVWLDIFSHGVWAISCPCRMDDTICSQPVFWLVLSASDSNAVTFVEMDKGVDWLTDVVWSIGKDDEITGAGRGEGVENWQELNGGASFTEFQGDDDGELATVRESDALVDGNPGIPDDALFFFRFFFGEGLSKEEWSWLRLVPVKYKISVYYKIIIIK